MFKKVVLTSLIAALASTGIVPVANAVTESTPTKALVSTTWLQANISNSNLIGINKNAQTKIPIDMFTLLENIQRPH